MPGIEQSLWAAVVKNTFLFVCNVASTWCDWSHQGCFAHVHVDSWHGDLPAMCLCANGQGHAFCKGSCFTRYTVSTCQVVSYVAPSFKSIHNVMLCSYNQLSEHIVRTQWFTMIFWSNVSPNPLPHVAAMLPWKNPNQELPSLEHWRFSEGSCHTSAARHWKKSSPL